MSWAQIKTILNLCSAVAALIAALLWWRASTVVVRPKTRIFDGWSDAQVIVKHQGWGEFDPFETGISQSKWNAKGALAASLAAALQGLALLLPDA